MKIGIFWALMLWITSLNGQAKLLFSGNPIIFSDKNEIPKIRELIEEFNKDSSLNNKKLSENEFRPYLEMIQNSTVALTKFKLIGQEMEMDFLDAYKSEFSNIDKSPLYCSCHIKRFILNQEGQLIEDEKGVYYKILTFGVGQEGFSDLAFGILLRDGEFTSIFTHFDKMNYKALRSNFAKGELTIIYSKAAKLVLENSENGYLIGRFEMMSNELPTGDSLDYHFDISGEFSCKIE
jgi:hypothetical protein